MLGQVSYTEALSGASHTLSFQLPLKPSDLLRPHKISTQQFGAMWPAHAAERKTVVTTAAAAAAPKWPLLARGRALHTCGAWLFTRGAPSSRYSSLVGGAMHLAAVQRHRHGVERKHPPSRNHRPCW